MTDSDDELRQQVREHYAIYNPDAPEPTEEQVGVMVGLVDKISELLEGEGLLD